MVNRHYYGLYCPYGTRTISDGDYAISFDTKKDRDNWVGDGHYDGSNFTREVTTLDYIRRHKVPITTNMM